MSETHVAGLDITVNDRYLRQRCAWCGAIIIDIDLTRIGVPEGQDPRPATWQIGALIRKDGPYRYIVEDEKYPDDACLALDPEVTT